MPASPLELVLGIVDTAGIDTVDKGFFNCKEKEKQMKLGTYYVAYVIHVSKYFCDYATFLWKWCLFSVKWHQAVRKI